MNVFGVKSLYKEQMVDISAKVAELVPSGFNGVCTVFSRHTTAAITINENADPDVVSDLLQDLRRLIPDNSDYYQHFEGNSSAHLKCSMFGASETLPVVDGRLALGTWQGIYFCEFDGPRNREVLVTFIGE